MDRPVHLVIARHEENLKWSLHLPPNVHPMTIQKGAHLPNEGREAASYCWAFKNFEFADDDIICCVQGDPFVHSPNLVRELYNPPSSFAYPLGWVTECDGDGAPHHSGLPVAERYEEWFGVPFPGSLEFLSGAQFFVSGAELKDKDWDLWYERSCTEHGPWLMERFWPVIFSGK